MADAKIQFTQGASVGTPGKARLGVTGTAVTVGNGDDADVEQWTFIVVDAPPTSAVPIGTVQSGTTPTWSFTPDVPDVYLITLETKDNLGVVRSDTRAFGVLRTSNRIIPPFNGDSDSLNFENAPWSNPNLGWDPPMRAWLEFLDTLSGSADAVSIRGVPVDATAPTTSGQVLRYDSTTGKYLDARLTFDDIDAAFTPTLSFHGSPTTTVIIGTTVSPTFDGNPEPNASGVTAYTISDNQGGGPTSRFGSAGNFAGPSASYTINAPGTLSFSGSVTKNGVTKTTTSNPSYTYASQFWTGVGTAGATGLNGATGALVGATGTLTAVLATNPVGVGFSPSPSAQKVIAVCEAGSLHVCHDANGDLVPMTRTHASITVAINGINRTMDLYESDNLLTTIATPFTFVS